MCGIVAALGANQGMVKVVVRNVQYRDDSGYRIEGVRVVVRNVQYRGGSGCRIMVL